jgi:hypothetical protein
MIKRTQQVATVRKMEPSTDKLYRIFARCCLIIDIPTFKCGVFKPRFKSSNDGLFVRKFS